MRLEDEDAGKIMTIEWHMLEKHKLYPLIFLSSFSVRTLLYPFSVIKTRIQIQKKQELYRGTWDAYKNILKYEGYNGLYKGFMISSFQILSGLFYITSYESTRHILKNYTQIQDTKYRAFIAGGCASLVNQTILVPCDIVSQHMMVLGRNTINGKIFKIDTLDIGDKYDIKRKGLSKAIISQIYKKDGLIGFYRGYFASLLSYVPNSAIWWSSYQAYSNLLATLAPVWVSHLFLQCLSAPMAGITSAFCTNPLDIIRARIQVSRMSYLSTIQTLWEEEKLGIFKKGLSARCTQSIIYSFFIILGYESMKRFSVKDEYKKQIRW
ncbi:unnamed protein product [Gordionus sp. m RMFG-2023]|uniref:solute carrier family 25 member 44-like n=1 Tax=Gordionus sp. m RMFG-2023 TaxID=3053472 RepID=UPI0030E0486C